MSQQDALRQIPSVDALLAEPPLRDATARHGRRLVIGAVRRELESLRSALLSAGGKPDLAPSELAARIATRLEARSRGTLRDVINATGVLVHTNLGRAPLGVAALDRVRERATGATDLEMDLATGRRGVRARGCEELLAELTGAEAAGLVNNGAAGLLLALATFARGKSVLVSRGELVEIGGSFRIPDICASSGARLVEVGTTNRTRLSDYEEALSREPDVALLLKVHPSNFRIVGFTEEVALKDLVELGRRAGVPVVMDQGSGALEDLSRFGVQDEVSVPDVVATGADVVIFSGDKLLGGPQAGCLVGREAAITACRKNPLFRALRVGRLVASALEATLWAHASGREDEVPVQAQLRASPEAIRARAESLVARLGVAASGWTVRIEESFSTSGGGSSPASRIPTWVVSISGGSRSIDELSRALRAASPAVVARIGGDALLLDLRTVPPERDGDVATAIANSLA